MHPWVSLIPSMPALCIVGACGGGGAGHDADAGADPADAGGTMDADGPGDAGRAEGGPDSSDAVDTGSPEAGPMDTGAADTAPPYQDGCEVEEDLGSATGIDLVIGSTVREDDDLRPECTRFGGEAPDIIYRWQAPSGGTWTFDTTGSSFDTVLHVRDLDCRLRACNDDQHTRTLTSRTTAEVEAGEELFVVVDGAGRSAGLFHLSITETVAHERDCGDGQDEDRDGRTDCLDFPDCFETGPCVETSCADGEDNDGDGFVDCSDAGCFEQEPCKEVACGDGADGDFDFFTDCDDSDCAGREPCAEAICNDGLDADMNGLTDCDDPGCTCSPSCIADTCPDEDLGSVVGIAVATGVTEGCSVRAPTAEVGDCVLSPFLSNGNDFLPQPGTSGEGPEKTLLWTAPESRPYTFDLAGSTFDTTLYLLDGCDGATLACNEETVPTTVVTSRVTMDFTAGQSVVVVVDGWGGESGNFTLSILPE